MSDDPAGQPTFSQWAEPLAARIGSVGVYATPADLVGTRRTRGERATRALLTFAATILVAPVAFLIPPHMEPPVVVLIIGIYFTRRAWVGEWVAERMTGTCPRCDAAVSLKPNTVLYLPHTLHCRSCRGELWLELGAAPSIADDVRHDAMSRMTARPASPPGGKPPQTWSPAASDWRDRRRR